MNKTAYDNQDKNKMSKVQLSEPPAQNIVDMGSLGGALGDYLSPGLWGGERAGRTQAMADAIGEDTTFGVRHPLTHTLLNSIGGGLGGMALGGLTSYGLNRSFGKDHNQSAEKSVIPLLAGGALGALAGPVFAGNSRRKEMKRINHFYDKDRAEGKVNPKTPQLSTLAALLAPFRGPHRTGQVEAVKAMRGEKTIPEQHDSLRNLLYAAQHVPFVSGSVGLTHNYLQNLDTQLAANNMLAAEKDHGYERKQRHKKASFFAQLAQEAVKSARCWKGYEPVPGKAPYSEDSCRPKGSAKKKKPMKTKKASDTHSFVKALVRQVIEINYGNNGR